MLRQTQYPALQMVIGTAGLDPTFRNRLLNLQDRAQAIEGFDLSNSEKTAILSIQANSLTDLARSLMTWVNQQA